MSTTAKPALKSPTSTKGGSSPSPVAPEKSNAAKQQFVGLAIKMSWQLATVVLVPIIGGSLLDKALKTNHTLSFIGLGVAAIGSVLVMWGIMQEANRLPVPKLTDAEKKAVKNSYDEDDD